MSKRGLPNSEEWNRIIDLAFSSDKDHDFSVLYELRKADIQKGITMKKTSNHIRGRYLSMVAAAAAIVIAAPTAVYVWSKEKTSDPPVADIETTEENTEAVILSEKQTEAEPVNETVGSLTTEKNGEYQYILRYKPSEEQISDDNNYDVAYTWLPEGVCEDETSLKHEYNTPEGGCFDSCYYRVSANTPLLERIGSIVEYDNISDDEKTAYIFHRNIMELSGYVPANSFGRVSWIHFTDTNFVVELFATDDISDDDLIDIINGMTLVPSDTATTGTWFNREESTSGSVYTEPVLSPKNTEDYLIIGIGDSITDTDWYNNSIEITVNDAWVQDNFDGITTDTIGRYRDYSEYLYTDGKIYETYQYGTLGDGINTLDRIDEVITVQQKIIVLDLTYKNTDNNDIYEDFENGKESYPITPDLVNPAKGDVNWRVNTHQDGMTVLNHSQIASEDFLSLDTDNKGSKNSINIPAGGSTHVRLAFIANENDLDDLYVDITGRSFFSEETNPSAKPLLSVKKIK